MTAERAAFSDYCKRQQFAHRKLYKDIKIKSLLIMPLAPYFLSMKDNMKYEAQG